ncbi:MAG TPA: UbiX family flavin prenyltransferase [Candidatus Desulfofervidus auxilii]|uniref:Flavin prenyltransferase UbiX n=1 Tax=Desulfofervidus auxilii TaxID=1621989 RepID=A0A7V0NEX4_DESA2|nr:UbiX family flavin prenyltransferase [Candidatus Desulfofervidus auxilii]
MGEIRNKILNSSYILAITGASGMLYAQIFLRYFYENKIPLCCLVSKVGQQVWEWEMECPLEKALPPDISLYTEDDWSAPIASGSVKAKAMVIMPCSMGTLAAIAQGLAHNLIQRTADVMLKEKRTLILVPRETPLNVIHLKNMLSLAKAGAIVLPAMPGFYHKPKTIQDLANFVVARILDLLGLEHKLINPWEGI